MHRSEVNGLHLERVKSEFRRQIDQLDADWRWRFNDLDRRLREAKTACEALEWRVRATAHEIGDGMMMVMMWAPPILVLILTALGVGALLLRR